MTEAALLELLADVVLAVHAALALFVVSGPVLVLAGMGLGWRWTRNLWYRLAHLGAIGVVVAQAWAGWICPLTRWESGLRRAAGGDGYAGSFIGHWLQQALFYQAEPWVFTAAYTAFAVLVALTWWFAPPRFDPGRRAPR